MEKQMEKKKVVKRVGTLILAFMMLLAMGSVSLARWSYLHVCSSDLEDKSTLFSRKLEFYADVDVYEGNYCGIEAQLQKSTDGGETWTDVKDKYWNVYEEDTYTCIDETFSVSGAGKYRCLVMYIAYTNTGFEIESEPFYTKIVTLY